MSRQSKRKLAELGEVEKTVMLNKLLSGVKPNAIEREFGVKIPKMVKVSYICPQCGRKHNYIVLRNDLPFLNKYGDCDCGFSTYLADINETLEIDNDVLLVHWGEQSE